MPRGDIIRRSAHRDPRRILRRRSRSSLTRLRLRPRNSDREISARDLFRLHSGDGPRNREFSFDRRNKVKLA
jgi:hypothetical protein